MRKSEKFTHDKLVLIREMDRRNSTTTRLTLTDRTLVSKILSRCLKLKLTDFYIDNVEQTL